MSSLSVEEWEQRFGAQVRAVRAAQGHTQVEVARLANVSRSAVVNLEAGAGSSLTTIVKVLDALGHTDWLLTLQPPVDTFNPLDLLDPPAPPRRGRARGPRPERKVAQ